MEYAGMVKQDCIWFRVQSMSEMSSSICNIISWALRTVPQLPFKKTVKHFYMQYL